MTVRGRDRGSVTAEFAIALPAVVLVLALGAATLASCGRQVRLQDAAADAARLVSRGESDARALAVIGEAVGGATGRIERRDDLVCVHAAAPTGVPLPLPEMSVSSCALHGGW